MALKSLIRFGAGITWHVISRILFFIFLGVVVNWILFFFLPDMCDLEQSQQGGMMAYFQELISDCFFSFAVGVAFLIGFPLAYVFLGYKQGLQGGIYYAYVKNKATFYEYISNRMLSFVEGKQKGDASVVQLAGNFLEKLNKVLKCSTFKVRATPNMMNPKQILSRNKPSGEKLSWIWSSEFIQNKI